MFVKVQSRRATTRKNEDPGSRSEGHPAMVEKRRQAAAVPNHVRSKTGLPGNRLKSIPLRRRLDMDAAGDGADFDAAAGSADMGAQGVFVLIFDDDGEVGPDLAGDGFGGV